MCTRRRPPTAPYCFLATYAAALLSGCAKDSSDSTQRDSTAGRASRDSTVIVGKTKLQAFQAKTGAVIVVGFSDIGTVPGMYGASTSIEAREMTDASSGARASGVVVTVQEPGTLERRERSYVDYDELESLLKGIDYIAKIDRNPTKLADFQADYRTRGDLTVSTFSSSNGRTMLSVKSGLVGTATAFYPLTRLTDLRAAVARAKTVLDSIAVAASPDSGRRPPEPSRVP